MGFCSSILNNISVTFSPVVTFQQKNDIGQRLDDMTTPISVAHIGAEENPMGHKFSPHFVFVHRMDKKGKSFVFLRQYKN